MFGDIFGDFAQLPLVGDRSLYAKHSCNSNSPIILHGHTIYKMFTKVVQIFRQSGLDSHVQRFKDILSRTRDGIIDVEDWHALLQRSPEQAENVDEFTDAVRLYYDRESTAVFNVEKFHSLGMPVATIKAVDSSSAAASAKPDDAGGLYPIVHLAKGARVMLTANLWQQVGLCNGAAGTVYGFMYAEGHAPPTSVLIDFDKYIGPSFLHQLPKCIPIPPVTCEWHSTFGHLSRQRLPLLPKHAMTCEPGAKLSLTLARQKRVGGMHICGFVQTKET